MNSPTKLVANNIVRSHKAKVIDPNICNGKIVNFEFIVTYFIVGFICERFHSHLLHPIVNFVILSISI